MTHIRCMGDTMNNIKLTFFALPLSIFLSTVAFSQALEEVVVTAQKTEVFKIHLLQLQLLLRLLSKT